MSAWPLRTLLRICDKCQILCADPYLYCLRLGKAVFECMMGQKMIRIIKEAGFDGGSGCFH